jgi:hypothetical protein
MVLSIYIHIYMVLYGSGNKAGVTQVAFSVERDPFLRLNYRRMTATFTRLSSFDAPSTFETMLSM